MTEAVVAYIRSSCYICLEGLKKTINSTGKPVIEI